ncbi:MAG: M56 family metallopeptidase [Eubacteriales bacterium]|nr:M56 family metallopeptidase [Eubacteriales bacterium]
MEGFVLHILKLNIIAAVIILLVKLMSVFLKGKFTAQWKYLVWLMLSLSLLIPVRMPARLSVFHLPVNETVQKLSENPIMQSLPQNGPDVRDTGTELTSERQNTDFSGNVHKVGDSVSIFSIFLILWLAIAVLKLIWETVSYHISMKNLKRMSLPVYNPVTLRVYSSVYRLKDIQNPPNLLQNAGISTPLLTGLLKTELYLPAVGYTAEELKLIFHHELSHYRRRDLWYKMLLRICSTVYWFNPFLHIMLKEADNDIENLCDTNVIRHCTVKDHRLYRKLLLRTAAIENHVPYVSASLNDSTMVFKDRILYMLNLKHLKRNRLPGIILTALLIAANTFVVFSAVTDSPDVLTDISAETAKASAKALDYIPDKNASPAASRMQAPADASFKPVSYDSTQESSPADNALQAQPKNTPLGNTLPENTLPESTLSENTLSENISDISSSEYEDSWNGISSGSAQTGDASVPDTTETESPEPAPSVIPYTGGFNNRGSGYINTVIDSNGNITALKDNGNGTYSNYYGTNFTYNGGTSWTDEYGESYATLDDRYHYEGMELDSHILSGSDGSTSEVIRTTNGDYFYRDDNGTGFTDNGDGSWTDEYGNTYSE